MYSIFRTDLAMRSFYHVLCDCGLLVVVRHMVQDCTTTTTTVLYIIVSLGSLWALWDTLDCMESSIQPSTVAQQARATDCPRRPWWWSCTVQHVQYIAVHGFCFLSRAPPSICRPRDGRLRLRAARHGRITPRLLAVAGGFCCWIVGSAWRVEEVTVVAD